MKLKRFIALSLTLLALSGCVVEPIGGSYREGRGGSWGGYQGGHDEGRRVWR